MRSAVVLLVGLLGSSAVAADDEPPAARACMNARDTREAVGEHKLLEPLEAVRSVQSTTRAELLSTKLCRWNEDFVYEVTFLRRDGRVVRVFMNAKDGKVIPPRAAH